MHRHVALAYHQHFGLEEPDKRLHQHLPQTEQVPVNALRCRSKHTLKSSLASAQVLERKGREEGQHQHRPQFEPAQHYGVQCSLKPKQLLPSRMGQTLRGNRLARPRHRYPRLLERAEENASRPLVGQMPLLSCKTCSFPRGNTPTVGECRFPQPPPQDHRCSSLTSPEQELQIVVYLAHYQVTMVEAETSHQHSAMPPHFEDVSKDLLQSVQK
mmetsp:Transcript_2388/g.7392  ORF Transcript_2388/g.7392 Transcript_2388/m.7392 type:complete len:214 (-) Transcript_2388:525-1166(-)